MTHPATPRPTPAARPEAAMFTNPNPPSELHERIDAYAALLSAGHALSRAVMLLQTFNLIGFDIDEDQALLRKQALEELYRANDTYIDAYMKVYPKQPPATQHDGSG